MKISIDNKAKTVTIVLDLLSEPRMSGTGATMNVAEARNQFTGVKHESGHELKVNAAVYWPIAKSERTK